MCQILSFGTACMLAGAVNAQTSQEGPYEPNWESLDARPTPQWFQDAKFGIFIHWGVYSVPAWAPKGTYSEWYGSSMQDKNGPTWKFHERVYGPNFKYEDFAPLFTAELFDPTQWADFIVRSGAQYLIPTSKHHDGFCLWPSQDANRSWGKPWNSVDIGPKRDLLGELTDAVRARGVKVGFYYSLYEWFNPLYLSDFARYRDEHFFPQFKDVVTRYKPSIIFTDGEWEHTSEEWRSPELLAWLFNDSPVRDEVVINDRWGKDCRSEHGGYFTTEYGEVGEGKSLAAGRAWEENRGMGASFGYNRNEDISDYRSAKDLVHLLVDVVSRGGNLNLDIGPSADGRIPVIMQERLLEIGDWLSVNGEAIYSTRPWRERKDGETVRYTAKPGSVYAICLEWPGETLMLAQPKADGDVEAHCLGLESSLKVKASAKGLKIALPRTVPDSLRRQQAWAFRLTGVK